MTVLSWGCCFFAQEQPARDAAFDAALGSALGAWTQHFHAFWHLGTAAALWSAAKAVRLVRLAHSSDFG